jgi:hypothetical protein
VAGCCVARSCAGGSNHGRQYSNAGTHHPSSPPAGRTARRASSSVALAVLLALEEAAYVNGAEIRIDGGILAG